MTSPSIFPVQAKILSHLRHDGGQMTLRLHAPKIVANAKAGQFVHITPSPLQPLRRPISIMLTHPDRGDIDLFYKIAGAGTELLSQATVGATLDVLGPIGQPFQATPKKRFLLIGGGVGMPPMIFLAKQFMEAQHTQGLVLLGSEIAFPFQPQPSRFLIPGLANGVIAAMPLLEDWHIASRLASGQDQAGCFSGYVTALAKQWLDTLSTAEQQQVSVFSCGPTPMLQAVAALSREYQLPCQLSLEEYMACGVGGCAGCTVPTYRDGVVHAMKRVCVDGPVFDADEVMPF